MDARIRDMTADDCHAVATVRVRGWQFAYAGLMPQPYLDALDIEAQAARRREVFEGGRGKVVNVVAERDGEVIGWGCCGPYREDDGSPTADGELYALYLLPEHLSTGVGRALAAELTARAATAGFPVLRLWVLKENARARRFYEKAGFAADGAEEPFEVDGVLVPEVRYSRPLSATDAAAPNFG
ncbi:GNAT family N-acetyltransferase [Streptomyces beijiangensis]|uniref:GNAT family N-acetyltransferase n=1 Tax=Streptomyces beijiangensis TaxID=163361 RepID=A0A939F333_9ACTN|nr:GNAT family N-acetyltransferase [Streptomyces beijiangensis]MBO0511222.1 GNAT family N-acetyltransferase [Streptomyces beijiangensis]